MAKQKHRKSRPKFYLALKEQHPEFIEALDSLGQAARAAGLAGRGTRFPTLGQYPHQQRGCLWRVWP